VFYFQRRNILSPRLSQVWWKIILMIATITDLFSSQITVCAVVVTTVLVITVTAVELFCRMYNLRKRYIYRVSQEECARLHEGVLYVKDIYTGCPRRNVPDFTRVFFMLKYTDITQNIYVQSWTVTEIMAREKCGLLAGPRIVPFSWQVLSMFVLECGVLWQKVRSH